MLLFLHRISLCLYKCEKSLRKEMRLNVIEQLHQSVNFTKSIATPLTCSVHAL